MKAGTYLSQQRGVSDAIRRLGDDRFRKKAGGDADPQS
jgi:hypothetical protein